MGHTPYCADSNNVLKPKHILYRNQRIIALDFTAFGTNILCYGDATASIKIDVTQQSVAP